MDIDGLRSIGMFSKDCSPVFDRVVEAARSMFNCSISLLSLVDDEADRQVFKAESGLSYPLSDVRETPLSHSLCKTVIGFEAPLVIFDCRTDHQFKHHPAVVDLSIVAYLGVPVINACGRTIAALCVVDKRPRYWSSDDVTALQTLAAGVSAQIILMLMHKTKETEAAELKCAINAASPPDGLTGRPRAPLL